MTSSSGVGGAPVTGQEAATPPCGFNATFKYSDADGYAFRCMCGVEERGFVDSDAAMNGYLAHSAASGAHRG